MELKLYLILIKKNLLVIIVCVALSASFAYFISIKAESGYKLEQSFLMSSTSIQTNQTSQTASPQIYDFDNFYNQEKARNFTDTAVAILQNPDFANSLNIGGSRISAQKLSPQLIKITVISDSFSDSQFTLERAVLEFNRKLKALDPQNSLEVKPIGTAREPIFTRINTNIALAAGAVFGLAVSAFLISVKTYFKL